MSLIQILSETKVFGGKLIRYSHSSQVLSSSMKFHVFFPPISQEKKTPVLFWLSGLTCTDENFVQKAGAFRAASQLGLALVVPDTSPRDVPDHLGGDSWDFGKGAGFYLNATTEGYSTYYNMYSYISKELLELVEKEFGDKIDVTKKSIFGHSMGGLGALNIFLKSNEGTWASASAFAPICNPTSEKCPWGQKAFTGYLKTREEWDAYDPSILVSKVGFKSNILIDQGTKDNFNHQLLTESFAEGAKNNSNVSLEIRYQEDYDHSYFFISTFVEDHLNFHAKFLQ